MVTRNPKIAFDGVVIANSLRDALEKSAGDDEIFVIGGEEIFRAALPLANQIHATEIASDYVGNAYFPALDDGIWQEVNAEGFREGQIHGRFVTYRRKSDG